MPSSYALGRPLAAPNLPTAKSNCWQPRGPHPTNPTGLHFRAARRRNPGESAGQDDAAPHNARGIAARPKPYDAIGLAVRQGPQTRDLRDGAVGQPVRTGGQATAHWRVAS